jgi:Tetracyclin repressor-like, C-terminal domain
MTDPGAADLMRGFMQRQLFEPAMARLDVDQPDLRADLVSSQLLGLGVARYILRFEPLASLPAQQVIGAVAPRIQQYVTGPLHRP